jgi:hypothetical protein
MEKISLFVAALVAAALCAGSRGGKDYLPREMTDRDGR